MEKLVQETVDGYFETTASEQEILKKLQHYEAMEESLQTPSKNSNASNNFTISDVLGHISNKLRYQYPEAYQLIKDDLDDLFHMRPQNINKETKVIVLPCSMDDTLYTIENGTVEPFKPKSVEHILHLMECGAFGDTVFLDPKEAEQELTIAKEEENYGL